MKTDGPDLLQQIKSLVAENVHLKSRLDELQSYTAFKEQEVQELKLKIAAGTETKSKLDNQLLEIEILQNYMAGLQQKAAGAVNRELDLEQQIGNDISEHHQFQDLQQQYIYLQAQLTDLQDQLQECNSRNVVLQQETSRMAVQESLLADAQQERDEWKALVKLKNK